MKKQHNSILPRFVQKAVTKMWITTGTLVCVHVEVAMHERKWAHRHSERRKNTQGKTINKSSKETYEKHFASYSGLWIMKY